MSEEIRNFSHDVDAAIRLYLQHWIFKFETGFLLHPLITTSQSTEFKILDVGCGTGLWLSDIARSFPHAQLHGFDLSTAHFPPKSELPENVQLWQQDACEPIPSELLGQYDLVHVARFHMYIGDDSLNLVAENFNSLLKPGGWLEWDDIDVSGMHVARNNSDKSYPAFEEMHARTNAWLQSQKSTSSALDEIPQVLGSHGFECRVFKRWEVSSIMSKPWTDMQLIANRDYSENVIMPGMQKAGASQEVVDQARMLRSQVEAEVTQQGLRILMDMVYIVAQKLQPL